MEEKITRLPERHEKKYWINPKDMAVLRSRLSRVLARDSHADKNGNYFIRSLYFDDAFNSAYYDKMRRSRSLPPATPSSCSAP